MTAQRSELRCRAEEMVIAYGKFLRGFKTGQPSPNEQLTTVITTALERVVEDCARVAEDGEWGCNHPLDAGGCDFARIATAIRRLASGEGEGEKT